MIDHKLMREKKSGSHGLLFTICKFAVVEGRVVNLSSTKDKEDCSFSTFSSYCNKTSEMKPYDRKENNTGKMQNGIKNGMMH